jgi:hypothetical protein
MRNGITVTGGTTVKDEVSCSTVIFSVILTIFHAVISTAGRDLSLLLRLFEISPSGRNDNEGWNCRDGRKVSERLNDRTRVSPH